MCVCVCVCVCVSVWAVLATGCTTESDNYIIIIIKYNMPLVWGFYLIINKVENHFYKMNGDVGTAGGSKV